MGLIAGLAEPVAFVGVVIRFGRDTVRLQGAQHVAGLLWYHDRIQLPLKENNRHADVGGVQQGRARGITLGIPVGIANQPVHVIAFELMGIACQRRRVADPVQAGACPKYVLECQRAQRGVTACAAATNEGMLAINQPLIGQIADHCTGILHIHVTPFQVQRLPVLAAIAGATPVVEVRDGKAALRPVLNARVEHRITRRGRATMDKHHQRRLFFAVHRRVEKSMSLAPRRGVAQRLRAADAISWQWRHPTGQHRHLPAVAGNAKDGRRAYR